MTLNSLHINTPAYRVFPLQIPSLTAFVDGVLNFYRTRFLVGEIVEISAAYKS